MLQFWTGNGRLGNYTRVVKKRDAPCLQSKRRLQISIRRIYIRLNTLYMFKAEYQTPLRCHTVQELLEFPLTPKTKEVDLFLYLIDAYDIVYAKLDPPFTNTQPFEQLTLKLRTFQCIIMTS